MTKLSKQNTEILNVLRKAARCQKKVKVKYSMAYSKKVITRVIAPYSFDAVQGLVWVWDFSTYRGLKSFYLEGILSAEILTESFRPKFTVELG